MRLQSKARKVFYSAYVFSRQYKYCSNTTKKFNRLHFLPATCLSVDDLKQKPGEKPVSIDNTFKLHFCRLKSALRYQNFLFGRKKIRNNNNRFKGLLSDPQTDFIYSRCPINYLVFYQGFHL